MRKSIEQKLIESGFTGSKKLLKAEVKRIKADYQKEYRQKYQISKNYCFSKERDKEIIDWLSSQPNKQKYIKQLVLNDIRRGQNDTEK